MKIDFTEEQAKIVNEISNNWDFYRGIVSARLGEIKGGQIVLDINADGVLVNIGRLYPNRIEQIWRRKADIAALDTRFGNLV